MIYSKTIKWQLFTLGKTMETERCASCIDPKRATNKRMQYTSTKIIHVWESNGNNWSINIWYLKQLAIYSGTMNCWAWIFATGLNIVFLYQNSKKRLYQTLREYAWFKCQVFNKDGNARSRRLPIRNIFSQSSVSEIMAQWNYLHFAKKCVACFVVIWQR